MKRNLLGFKIFLEWIIPEDWYSHTNKTKDFNWLQALKGIGLLFVLFMIIFLLEERFVHNIMLIVFFSLCLAFFFFFLEYFLTAFTQSVSSPEVTVYKSIIRIRYWGSREDVFINDIISYKFDRLTINSDEVSVLVLQLKKKRTFEIGLPTPAFEQSVQNVLTQTFNIPYYT